MDLTALRAKSRRYTKTTATNYPNTDLDADINIANGEIHMIILEAEGYSNTNGGFEAIDLEDTSSLTEGELGYYGEYPFPSDSLEVLEAHIKYTSTGDYVQAEIINRNEVGSEMFEDNEIYSTAAPKIFIFRDSYFVRPLLTDTTVTDGIKLLVTSRQDDLSEATDEPTFEKNFHNLIPLKVALDYYLIYPEKYNPRIDKKAQEQEAMLISHYQSKIKLPKRMRTNDTDRGLENW